MSIVLRTSCSNDYNADCDFAVIDLNSEEIGYLIDKIDLCARLKSEDQNVYEIRLWDHSPDWISYDEGVDEEIGDKEFASVDLRNIDPQRIDCCWAVVDSTSVHWQCIPKHTDIYVYTTCMSKEDLKSLL